MFSRFAKDYLYSVFKRCREIGLFVTFDKGHRHCCYISKVNILLEIEVSYGDFVSCRMFDNYLSQSLKVYFDLSNPLGRNKLQTYICETFNIDF